jgi:hypothetical protein
MIEKRWSRSIHTSEGKLVTARPHEATFNGSHNSCKSKALIVLYHRKQKISETTGLTQIKVSQVGRLEVHNSQDDFRHKQAGLFLSDWRTWRAFY